MDIQYSYKMYMPKTLPGSMNSLDCCDAVPPPKQGAKKTKEKVMEYENMTASDLEISKRDYLKTRAYDIWEEKVDKAARDFGIVDDERPNTPKELVERIKAGLYVLPQENSPQSCQTWDPMCYIMWRDPAKVADREGYEAYKDKLSPLLTDLKDSLAISPLDEALKDLKVWETVQ